MNLFISLQGVSILQIWNIFDDWSLRRFKTETIHKIIILFA